MATGGGTQVPVWMHSLADATGLPVHVAAVPEGAALGSAFIARCVAGEEVAMTDAARWARTAQVIDPDPAWVAVRRRALRAVQSRYSKCCVSTMIGRR